jgi:hypothetical protein
MAISHDNVQFTLLDNAFNGLLKGILYPETGIKTISDDERERIARAFTNLTERIRESLEHGVSSEYIIRILYYSGGEIDLLMREIALNNAENALIRDNSRNGNPTISDEKADDAN